VRTLGALEARYADDHVPLALVLGAIGTLSAVRKLLPDEPRARAAAAPAASTPTSDPDPRSSPEPFIALLLGAVATHECLLRLFGPTLAEHRARDAESRGGGNPMQRLEGLMR